MIKIYVKKTSNYPVDTPKLKKNLKKFLTKKGIKSDCQVEISIVGKDRMYELSKKFLGEEKTLHNVLSFSEDEVEEEFVYPEDKVLKLGEVVICYPVLFEEAKKEGKKIDEKAIELAKHGVKHLLGEHHN